MRHPERPDVSLLDGVVSDRILNAMRAASAQLTKLGIRHALAGGLAVGAHGYPRATKDVDFLVGEEAFQHYSGGIVAVAPGVPIAVGDVAVDPLSISPEEDHLDDALEQATVSHGIPVLSVAALIYLKLKSPRQKDSTDILELLKAGVDADSVRDYLAVNSPDLLGKFEAIYEHAEEEMRD